MSLPRSSLDLKCDAMPILAALLSTGHYTAGYHKDRRWEFERDKDDVPVVVAHAVMLAQEIEWLCENAKPIA